MPGSWKKSWTVEAGTREVVRALKNMPVVYVAGVRDGVLGWVGRTYAHQRRDFQVKPPRLTVEKEGSRPRLVFQHDRVRPVTYTLEIASEAGGSRVEVEVKSSGTSRDPGEDEQIVLLFYALCKALEPASGS